MTVLFVVMPFGAIRPAIGVSLLKSHLTRIGIRSRVLYLNMRFAQQVGLSDYDYVAERAPSNSLAGDWIFAPCLSGRRPAADENYLKEFAERFSMFGPVERPIATLRHCRQVAAKFLSECVEEVDWRAYPIIGFTSTFSQHVAGLALAKRLKLRFPELQIVFGGANCEEAMGLQTHRSFPFVDFVCSGEADISFPRLVQALRGGTATDHIPGVISRQIRGSQFISLAPQRAKNLDELPIPEYDDYFEQLAALELRPQAGGCVLMESSRGCWWGEKHHCTFCGLNGTSMTFRSKSAERVLQEINELDRRYKPEYIEMVDNILDMKYFRDLVPELIQRHLKLRLFYETKANLSKEHIRAMRDAGIATIQPGIESLNTDVLRLMRKGTSAMQNLQLLKWCKEFGIVAYWNLLYGFPREDPAAYDAMASVIEFIHHLRPPHAIGPIRLDRFSPNFVSAEALGISNVRPDRNYRYIYDLTDNELGNLAYYFEHDYDDGRDPETYVVNARRGVLEWHKNSDNRGLIYVDHGDNLAVWDLRPKAKRTLTILSAHQRAVFLYCDQHRSFEQIQAFLRDRQCTEAIQEFLDELIDYRLMIRLEGRYLTLAVPAASSVSAHTWVSASATA